jgi:probable O-glycosylation ligase (exosortase A-associated)
MRDLLLVGVVFVCAFVALRHPVIGILAFTCLGFLNPHSMTWGRGRILPLSQIVAIGTIIGYLLWQPKRFPRQRETILLLLLWGMFGVSTIFAIYPQKAFEFFIKISKILLMVLLATSLINNENRLHWLLRIISLSIGFYGLKGGIFFLTTGGNYMVLGPEDSFLEANNAIGLALAMNVPLLFYLSKMENYKWFRWTMRAMLAFSYPATIGTFSRGAWVGLAIVTALVILRSKYRLLVMPIIVISGIIILLYFPQLFSQRVVERYGELANYKEESSAQSRFWNWECCKRVGFAHPLTGGGFDFYSKEIYEKYFPEFLERNPGKVWTCHSMWYTIFSNHGFPGFFLWAGLIGSCFFSLRRIRSYGKTHGNAMWFIYNAEMVEVALVAFMVVGTFYDAAYFDMFYYLVAVIVIIKERIRHLPAEASLPEKEKIKMTLNTNHTIDSVNR